MIDIGTRFSNRRILFLQGPLGPFFRRLALDLKATNAKVYKINFNGGDWFFYPTNSINFRYKLEEWPVFFKKVLAELSIDVVMLFGDARPMHIVACEIAHHLGLEVLVFEEGYVRPNYITLEQSGVNAHSVIPRIPDFYLNTKLTEITTPKEVGNTFWYAALWAILYYLSSSLLWPWFRHYKHHRPLNLLEIVPWLRSFWRKAIYAVSERNMQNILVSILSNKYFLVPLQVYNDAQISNHSKYNSIQQFIEEVVNSFATYAPKDTHLVIKHHPMDRGYHNYHALIEDLAQMYNLKDRLHYIHDQYLPTLLNHAKGTVLINSTVGLSALYHNTPLKVCGRAIYDMPGLTFTGTLDDFWCNTQNAIPDRKLFEHFYCYLINNTQLNGSFYKRLDINNLITPI